MSLHTDIPGRREVERLLEQRGDGLVSIYLPTSPITPEADAARIAFKNLSARAVEALGERGLATRDREAIAEELEDLHDDEVFWAGTIDEETGVVSLDEQERPGDYGVLDEIARRTLTTDGRVLAVRAEDVPTGSAAAALLRYPI
jgi:hypothetical protein